MQIDSQAGSKAHPESVKRNPVAASTVQPSASSPAPGTRDSQPASCRGGDAGQQPFHSVRPIPALVLTSILDHRPDLYQRLAANDRAYREAERRASGGKIGLVVMFAVALVIGLMLATGGAF